ncbi:unnamed protein product [Plasmodium vivax]|uniref:(malaria parasite P. vivax) hypothetical protein n=1 Tax=Plasmodium vivax TaxID=5855 RepID=A0A565A3A6_PLAVI|nr:unnamed protein product [Plasmodium vivax]VUZ99251.1 PIR protein [Plasmodium vivax]
MDHILKNFEDFFFKYKSIFKDNLNEYHQQYSQKCQNSGPIYIGESGSFSLPCIRCMKYLESLDSTYNDADNQKKEGILYLFIWLYDNELRQNIYSKENPLNIYENLLKEYEEIRWDTHTNILNIFYQKIKNIINSDIKDIYHLYYKLYKLKKDEECNINNSQCAKACYDLYDTYNKTRCVNNNSSDFCTKLGNFWKEHEEYINQSITCNGNIICLLYLKKPYLSVILTMVFISSIISIILFILYKFTPIGSRIRTTRKSKKNIWNNLDQEMYNIPDYTEMSNNNSKKKPYNLAYQSIAHSL